MHAITTRRTLFLALLLPTAAHAVSWHSGEHHNMVREGPTHGPLLDQPETSISLHDAAAIQDYYHIQTACLPSCPPSALPRPWMIGQPLPSGVATEPLPPDLKARVSPFYGYHYERVGDDVVLLADGTRVVAGAMPILIR